MKKNYHCIPGGLMLLGLSSPCLAQSPSPCTPPVARTTIEINNVRAHYLVGGPHWTSATAAGGFEVPKGSNLFSLGTTNFWIGGIDMMGQLKVAAQTYRQASVLGTGYWAGPLQIDNATTQAGFCNFRDQIWRIRAQDVLAHRNNFNNPGYQVPPSIANWPGNGDISFGFDPNLAPYVDVNTNGIYDPAQGDYPLFPGDEALWLVYNDRGNTNGHNSASIGLEVQETVFSFNRPGHLGNAVFMSYRIINRSTLRLDSVYMGNFVDPVLGNPIDDFVGCDVTRGMGIVFNTDDDDEGPNGYGLNPPAAALAVFRGLYSDFNDGLDNNFNGQIDELVPDCAFGTSTEHFNMWNFMVFNNDATVIGNPTTGAHVYNYLRGRWKDNTPLVFGGTGYPGSSGATTIPARYMIPGNTDPNGFGIGGSVTNPVSAPYEWNTLPPFTAGGPNVPAPGRRFVMSTGPITLMPGAVNNYAVGGIWARASSGGAQASVNALRTAKNLIQISFNDCSIFGLNGLTATAEAISTLRLFPNPARENAFITGNFEGVETLNLSLYNSSGQLVRKLSGVAVQGDRISIPLTDLAAGIYFVKVEAGAHERLLRLVKHH